MSEIIEDTITRNRNFQEDRIRRVKRLKELGAPDIIIETEEMISKMTIAEYEIYCQQLEEEESKVKAEYAKNNAIQKAIVDEIYDRESKLSYEFLIYSSNVRWMMAIDPLSFMSDSDYQNDLYITFLDHAKELYRERFKEQWEADND